ncbi:MAG: HNH endonuclease [Candidatus Nitrosocosmicus sp.]|nr:HNH endonuclease [Candidatus Nitrosocosmicus sp.]MDN5866877.1 HNH endonuclease [Candidatus Nitrosocosmicus sp.]
MSQNNMYHRCRTAPSEVRFRLRREAFFGCCKCGNPLIENAHIIEYPITKQFPIEDMLALCPNCHTEADLGYYPKFVLRDLKQNPFNKNKRYLQKRFVVTGEKLIINTGSSRFINTERIFTINDFDLVSITRKEGLYLSLNINLFDKYNRLIALIYDNFWIVDRSYLWDVEYKPQHLILRKKSRDIVLDIQIKNEEIFLRGNLYYNGFLIPIKPQNMSIGGVTIRNFTIENAGGGISIQVPQYRPRIY